ncbi:virion core protein [Pseudocowpox virus]|uniref:Virion core protein n=1 Tax=Pseudocowpox virus TaxID=129726 RepID=D3IZM8_9POXV|nr:virion core protein [Pseudocowpox virus]ADC53982.1 virion core protein [Pseudocowpox virus]
MDLRRRFAEDLAQTKLVLADTSSSLFTKCPQVTIPAPAAPCPPDADVDPLEKYSVKEVSRYYQSRLKANSECMRRPSGQSPLAPTPPCAAPRTQTPSCAPPAVCPATCPAPAPACPPATCPPSACPPSTCPPAPPLPTPKPLPAARPSLYHNQVSPPDYPAASCPTIETAPAASPVLESRIPDKVLEGSSTKDTIQKELADIADSVRDLSAESTSLTRDIENAKSTTQAAIEDLRRLLTGTGVSRSDTPSALRDRVDNTGTS